MLPGAAMLPHACSLHSPSQRRKMKKTRSEHLQAPVLKLLQAGMQRLRHMRHPCNTAMTIISTLGTKAGALPSP